MDKPELNADDVMKGIEDMMKGATKPDAQKIEVTDPEHFLPHERLIAKDIHALSHMLSLDHKEMCLALKRIVSFVEYKMKEAKDDSR